MRPPQRPRHNATRPDRNRRALLVAANLSASSVTGWPVGFWWSELTHPDRALAEAGYNVELRSPDGGTHVADSFSDPEDASGYSAHDIVRRVFKKSATHAATLESTRSIEGVDPAA